MNKLFWNYLKDNSLERSAEHVVMEFLNEAYNRFPLQVTGDQAVEINAEDLAKLQRNFQEPLLKNNLRHAKIILP